MKRLLFIASILSLAATAALAQDQKVRCQNDGPNPQPCGQSAEPSKPSAAASIMAASSLSPSAVAAAAPAPGPVTSDFPARTPTDHRFVVNGGAGLDTGCTYRAGGPLRIKLPIKRVVGEVNGEGYLADPTGIVQKRILPQGYVTLKLPAFDVDQEGDPSDPGRPPEQDNVYFNGHLLEHPLEGANGVWKENIFYIPIDQVKFGKQGENGSPATDGENEILIDIDTLGGNWCTYIDWVEATFDAMYPVIMVHGNSQDKDYWTAQNFVGPFRQALIPFDASISMDPNAAPIDTQSGQLARLLKERADQFGVKHFHIVAHSKGGLDVRDFLVRRIPELREQGVELGVLSLSTLSTPHHGSAGADYVLDVRQATPILGIRHSDDPRRAALARVMPTNDGYPNLRTSFVQKSFNPSNKPLPLTMTVDGETNSVSYFSFAADANLDHSRDATGPTIQSRNNNGQDETQGVEMLGIPVSSIPFGTRTVQAVYRLMGNVASTEVVPHPTQTIPLTDQPVMVVHENRYRGGFRLNDFLVTVDSARYPGFQPQEYIGANHANIAQPLIANRVINLVRNIPGPK